MWGVRARAGDPGAGSPAWRAPRPRSRARRGAADRVRPSRTRPRGSRVARRTSLVGDDDGHGRRAPDRTRLPGDRCDIRRRREQPVPRRLPRPGAQRDPRRAVRPPPRRGPPAPQDRDRRGRELDRRRRALRRADARPPVVRRRLRALARAPGGPARPGDPSLRPAVVRSALGPRPPGDPVDRTRHPLPPRLARLRPATRAPRLLPRGVERALPAECSRHRGLVRGAEASARPPRLPVGDGRGRGRLRDPSDARVGGRERDAPRPRLRARGRGDRHPRRVRGAEQRVRLPRLERRATARAPRPQAPVAERARSHAEPGQPPGRGGSRIARPRAHERLQGRGLHREHPLAARRRDAAGASLPPPRARHRRPALERSLPGEPAPLRRRPHDRLHPSGLALRGGREREAARRRLVRHLRGARRSRVDHGRPDLARARCPVAPRPRPRPPDRRARLAEPSRRRRPDRRGPDAAADPRRSRASRARPGLALHGHLPRARPSAPPPAAAAPPVLPALRDRTRPSGHGPLPRADGGRVPVRREHAHPGRRRHAGRLGVLRGRRALRGRRHRRLAQLRGRRARDAASTDPCGPAPGCAPDRRVRRVPQAVPVRRLRLRRRRDGPMASRSRRPAPTPRRRRTRPGGTELPAAARRRGSPARRVRRRERGRRRPDRPPGHRARGARDARVRRGAVRPLLGHLDAAGPALRGASAESGDAQCPERERASSQRE